MRVGLQTWGSDGDIRPAIALGAGLVRRGHRVTLAIASVDNQDYQAMCARVGVTCVRAPERFASSAGDLARRWGAGASSARMFQVLLREFLYPALREMQVAAEALCAESDVVVGHFMVWPLQVAARKQGTPWATLSYFPPLACNPAWRLPGLPYLGSRLNRGALWLMEALFLQVMGAEYAAFWRSQGVALREARPRHWFSPSLNLVAASPSLWPDEKDDGAGPYRLCGHLRMPEEASALESLSPELEAFLAQGAPPVFLTLGSSGETDPARAEAFLVETAKHAGVRAIVRRYTGGPPPNAGLDVAFAERVDHARLLPRCAAVLHHGGAGTAHSVLLAGCPSVVLAFMDEQTHWGRQLVRVGAAQSVLRYPRATPAQAAKAITDAARAPGLRERSEALGRRLREEDGVGTAVALLETLVHAPPERVSLRR